MSFAINRSTTRFGDNRLNSITDSVALNLNEKAALKQAMKARTEDKNTSGV